MYLDQDRLRAILNKELSYYGGSNAAIRKDGRLNLFPSGFLATQLEPSMRLLDVGCGDGHSLLDIGVPFRAGVGIDNDPEHIRMAQEARREMAVDNVEFLLLEFPQETDRLEPESFDIVLSNLGPIGDSPENIQAALNLLKPDGLIICAEIGELHQPEVSELFGRPTRRNQVIRIGERLRMWMVGCGVDIRLSADMFAKWCYPNVYEWFYYQCNIWTWCGVPLPAPDDPRIGLFAERNTNAAGEIETTHHVAWVAGVKQPGK